MREDRDWICDLLFGTALFLFGAGVGMALQSMRGPVDPNDVVQFGIRARVSIDSTPNESP